MQARRRPAATGGMPLAALLGAVLGAYGDERWQELEGRCRTHVESAAHKEAANATDRAACQALCAERDECTGQVHLPLARKLPHAHSPRSRADPGPPARRYGWEAPGEAECGLFVGLGDATVTHSDWDSGGGVCVRRRCADDWWRCADDWWRAPARPYPSSYHSERAAPSPTHAAPHPSPRAAA